MGNQSALDQEVNHSERQQEGLDSWWERAHQADHAFWLSGTPGPEVWRCLGVEDRLEPGPAVLNIGVGLGVCTRDLAAFGCRVSALDISVTALARVADVATPYLAEDVASLPLQTFDLVTNLGTFEHCFDQAAAFGSPWASSYSFS